MPRSTGDGSGSARRRRSQRLGVLTALVALLSGFVAVTGAATAGADTYPHCREHPQTGNGYVVNGKWLYIFWIMLVLPAVQPEEQMGDRAGGPGLAPADLPAHQCGWDRQRR